MKGPSSETLIITATAIPLLPPDSIPGYPFPRSCTRICILCFGCPTRSRVPGSHSSALRRRPGTLELATQAMMAYTGTTQPHAPVPSSLGTAAVNRTSTSYQDLRNPSASSSDPQYQQHYPSSHDQDTARYNPAPLPSSTILDHPYQQQTLSNTLANTHLSHPHQQEAPRFYAPAPTRPPGKFTEEWDASQRGSSIIEARLSKHYPLLKSTHNNMSSVQRSNSSAGSTRSGRGGDLDGAPSGTVSRSNTLKKKSSVRRNGSLGRSSSRRSMKAGSVRSLALQSNLDEDEMHSAFYCPVPTSGNPTEALVNRFQCASLSFPGGVRNVSLSMCPS